MVVNPSLGCSRCERCLAGQENLCRHFAILGEHVSGGQAERLAVPARNLFQKPKNLSFEEAAAVPLTFMTAWHAVAVRAALRPGETILVHAAGSGVGVAAVQIARLLGARVIATAGTAAKLERARALGADEVINYETQDFLAEVKRLTGRQGVDVVFEHVGKTTWEKSLLAAGDRRPDRHRGRHHRLRPAHRPAPRLLPAALHPRLDHGHRRRPAAGAAPSSRRGKLKPVVAQVLPLLEVVKAQAAPRRSGPLRQGGAGALRPWPRAGRRSKRPIAIRERWLSPGAWGRLEAWRGRMPRTWNVEIGLPAPT